MGSAGEDLGVLQICVEFNRGSFVLFLARRNLVLTLILAESLLSIKDVLRYITFFTEFRTNLPRSLFKYQEYVQ